MNKESASLHTSFVLVRAMGHQVQDVAEAYRSIVQTLRRRIEKDWCLLVDDRKRQRPGGLPKPPGAGSSSFKLSFQFGEGFRTRQQRNSSIFDFRLPALYLYCPSFFDFRVSIERCYQ